MSPKTFFLNSALFITLFFGACQKEEINGSRDYRTLGTSAHDLLSSDTYSSLQIEINYMPGYALGPATINNIFNFLTLHLNKPGGIQVFQQQINSSGKLALSLSEIVNIEKKNRTLITKDNTLAIHILITDGIYTANATSLGTSYWNTSLSIFGKAIRDNSGGPGQVNQTNLMSTILQHELGHLLGLVNQGSPMQVIHLDNVNGAHCNNTKCLMYYAIETGGMGVSIPLLDPNCIADLKANGGK